MEDHRLSQYGCEVGSARTRSPIVSATNQSNESRFLAWREESSYGVMALKF